MRFLADENVPEEFVRELRRLGFDVVSVREIRRGMKNHEIAELSKLDDRVVITLDKHFLWTCLSAGVRPAGVILLRPVKRFDARTLVEMFISACRACDSPYGKVIVVRRDKVRIVPLT